MTPAIDVCDLHYHYPDGTHALRGVSFSVAPDESVGLVGPNGAGKSTLLLHLNALLPDPPADKPPVAVGGLPATRQNLKEIRRRVGLLFQDANDQLFCPTVWEDVAFGPQQMGLSRDEVRARVATALERVHIPHLAQKPPHHLSGGEKRRACLAGLLACEPSILILDEPTTNLDPRGRRELIDLLRQLQLPMLIATHDLELVLELCPRTLVLDGGTIVAHGASRDLFADAPLMLAHGLEVPGSLRKGGPVF